MQNGSSDSVQRALAERRVRRLAEATERTDLVVPETGEVVHVAAVHTSGPIQISAARTPKAITGGEGRFTMVVQRAARQAITGDETRRPMTALEAQLFMWLFTGPVVEGNLVKLNVTKAARELGASANGVRRARRGLLHLGVLFEAVAPGRAEGGVYAIDPRIVWAGDGKHDRRRRTAAVAAWGSGDPLGERWEKDVGEEAERRADERIQALLARREEAAEELGDRLVVERLERRIQTESDIM